MILDLFKVKKNKSKMTTLEVPDLKYVSEYWFNSNPSLTHFMSALSVLFPEGERFFMQSMNKYRGNISEELLIELNEFCIQEANHGRLHTKLNSKFRNKDLLKKLENKTKNIINLFTNFLNDAQKLAVTVCLEHVTASMGRQLLNRNDLTNLMDSDVKNAWLYHSLEEVEHENVSMDIYNAVGINNLTRYSLYPLVLFILALVILKYWFIIMYDDVNGFDGIIEAFIKLFGFNGFVTKLLFDLVKF